MSGTLGTVQEVLEDVGSEKGTIDRGMGIKEEGKLA